MKKCLNCGKDNEIDAITCSECGEAFTGENTQTHNNKPEELPEDDIVNKLDALDKHDNKLVYAVIIGLIALVLIIVIPIFLKEKGKQDLSNSGFEEAWDFCDGRGMVKVDGKWGYINKKGEFIVKPEYSFANGYSDKVAVVYTDSGNWAVIDKSGKLLFEKEFEAMCSFYEGLACFKKDGKQGFVNKKGEIVIEPLYDAIGSFKEGLAYVKTGDKLGYINKQGEVVIPVDYKEGSAFSDAAAYVSNDGVNWFFIDQEGNKLFDKEFEGIDSFVEGLATVTFNNYKWGYIDKKGKTVIDPIFNDAGYFSEGLAPVLVNGLRSYINRKGHIIFETDDYGMALVPFSEGLAPVQQQGKYGFVNKKGIMEIKPRFEDAKSFKDGIAPVKIMGKWHYIDKNGKILF